MNKYRITGVAYEGDKFDYEQESELGFQDFVVKDISDLIGEPYVGEWTAKAEMNRRYGLTIINISATKVIVEGVYRLYKIEQEC